MDSNPTSNTPTEQKTTEDQQSARKLSISSQVQEYYSYPDAQVSEKPQSKSLPSGPTKSFKDEVWATANAFQSLTDVAGPEYFSSKNRRRDHGPSHHESASNPKENRHSPSSKVRVEQGDYSDGAKSLNQLEAESRHINEAVKAALQASLDTSGPRVPSPASSIASNKRGLEWDSGADVGYQYEHRDSSHLSIIERLALARGSAAFQLGSSGNGSLSKSGDMSISLNQKDDVKAVSKSLASLEIAQSSKSAQARVISEPLAQSTPQEADRRSLILAAAAAEDDISPLQRSNEQRGSFKYPTKKSLSATDLYLQEDIEATIVHCRRKSDTNISHEKETYSSYKPSVSSKSTSKSPVKQSTRRTRDQTVQTSNTVPIIKQSSIGVQAGEQSDAEKKSRSGSSSSEKSLNKVSLADAERFIAQIQRNASEHQKVIDKIKQQNLGVAKSTSAIKKGDYCATSTDRGTNRERSSSSSDFNETPCSVNVTNEHGTIGSANSFEYLPGDVYETANARQRQSPAARTSSDAIAWGVQSDTLARDLDDGVQNFKTLLGNRKDLDPQTKDQLIKRLVRKLIETDYQDDEASSTTGASVVYVPNQSADDRDGSDRSSARRRPRPASAQSPTFDRGDSRSISRRFATASSSERSSLPSPRGSASTSTTTTLETRDWRDALTQSERRRQPDKRHDELAQISRKIRQLDKLKRLLERDDCGERPASPNVYTVMTMLGVSSGESARAVESSAEDENWSSHHRMGTTRHATTQVPSQVRLTDRERRADRVTTAKSATTGTSESWDSSLDHRARHGRINVFVQTGARETDSRRSAEKQASVDPLCCCQCERKLTKLMEMSKSSSVSCRCGCHAQRPRDSSSSSNPSSCVCSERSRGDLRSTETTTSTTSNDAKAVQTSDSLAALPIIQPRWFPTGSSQEPTQKKQVCQCCGNEKDGQSARAFSESVSRGNVLRAAENDPSRCAVCFREPRFCSCRSGDKDWDVSAIGGKGLTPRGRANVSTKSRATETDAPKALGYVLTFETPSASEGSTAATPPPRPPLEEVRVKAARRGRPPVAHEPEHKRLSVAAPMQTSTPSTENASDLRSRNGSSDSARKPAAGSKASVASTRPTLQDYLRSNRPDYIETAEHRRQCLSELAHLRELRLQSRRKLLALASAPGKGPEVLSSLPPPPLATKRVFSQRTMLRQTRRLHQRTEEVGRKRSELKRKEDYRTNRLMAEMFARKLQKNVLKGSVNLSNSKSVI